MSCFQTAYPQTDPTQPPEHDAYDGGHDEIGFGGGEGNALDDQFGDDQEPDQEQVDSIQRKRDGTQFQIRFHRHNETQQQSNRDKGREHNGDTFPTEISVANIADEVQREQGGELNQQKGAQPDFVSAFLQLTAVGF